MPTLAGDHCEGAAVLRRSVMMRFPPRHHCTEPVIATARSAVMDTLINALQWPAMIVTLTAAWLIASQSSRKRTVGFWCFIASNILWIAWALHDEAYALIALQVGLFALNVRGVKKNDPVT
jgi:hypothetical protein